MGLEAPIFLMLSGGGLATMETACRFPIRMVESGPAGGAIFAAEVARQCGLPRVVSFDMGGTTAKICLVDDYRPQTARSCEVARVGRFKKGSGLAAAHSRASRWWRSAPAAAASRTSTRMGRIAVGPESAGADPGPACYGRGGINAAVTDANLAARPLRPGDLRRRHAAVEDGRGARGAGGTMSELGVGLDTEMAALGIVEIVDENMANAARVHAIESGKTFEGRTLIAFGGGGPVHATRLAEKVGIDRVIVPSGAGVGSAIGFLRAPFGYNVVRSFYQRWARSTSARSTPCSARWRRRPRRSSAQGSPGVPLAQSRIAYMRYVGQGHEIPVPLPDARAGARPTSPPSVPPTRPNTPSSTTGWCRAPTSRC